MSSLQKDITYFSYPCDSNLKAGTMNHWAISSAWSEVRWGSVHSYWCSNIGLGLFSLSPLGASLVRWLPMNERELSFDQCHLQPFLLWYTLRERDCTERGGLRKASGHKNLRFYSQGKMTKSLLNQIQLHYHSKIPPTKIFSANTPQSHVRVEFASWGGGGGCLYLLSPSPIPSYTHGVL
jgi:hypothetical protein